MIRFFKREKTLNLKEYKRKSVESRQAKEKKELEEHTIKKTIQSGSPEDMAKLLQEGAFENFKPGDIVTKIAEKTKEALEKTKNPDLADAFRKQMITVFGMDGVSCDDFTARMLIRENCEEAVLRNIDNFKELGEIALKYLDKYVVENLYRAGLEMRKGDDKSWEALDAEIENGFTAGKTAEEIMEGKNSAMQEWVQIKDTERMLKDYGQEKTGTDIRSEMVKEVTKLTTEIENDAISEERAVALLENITDMFKRAIDSRQQATEAS